MKKLKLPALFLILLFTIGLFLFQRYKTKRIDHLIGASKVKVESIYQATGYQVEEVSLENVEEEIQVIVRKEKIQPTGKILRLTVNGSVRKNIIWLADQGEGYYVIEALDTMH